MDRKLTALVIGNGNYPAGAKLKNPKNDADDLSERLERCGFSVIKKIDCTNKELDLGLKAFKKNLKGNDVGLFFFAGHGMQIDGDNYLNAIDTDFSDETDAKYSSLALNKVIELMEKSGASTNIIILDACRNNPFERAWNRSSALRGLAPIYAPKGTLIAFATSPGEVASDGRGKNGAYTEALLRHIDTPDSSIEEMFKRVRNTLSTITKQKQTSWEHTSLSGEFYFNLSLGARIDSYSRAALADGLFVLDTTKSSHSLIASLKTLTWPRQNPAIDSFDVAQAGKYSADSLFVIGRNIYQSACGCANSANAYIKNFLAKTNGLAEDKRKALLDGMLFEVFFDSKGELRRMFKTERFAEVFRLQQFDELSGSFDFISECLLLNANRFYSIPGKKHHVAVDVVSSSKKTDTPTIKAVHIAGTDILWMEDEFFAEDPGKTEYRSIQLGKFEEKLSDEMVVPAHLLKITYDFDRDKVGAVKSPRGYTLRKR
jgi:uncharacterized caspase-like protein